MPEVSVVMTIFNGERYVQEAIDSVLQQDFDDFEFIIINDGSADGSREIIESYRDPRIKLLNQANTGLGIAANNAIRQASGQWIARIDDDDIWEKHKLTVQLRFLQDNPAYVAIGSNAVAINHRGEELYPMFTEASDSDIRRVILDHNPFIHSSVIYRRDIFNRIGGYYEPMNKYLVDYLLLYQFSKFGKVANLQQPLVKYRISTSSIGHSFGTENPEVQELIRLGIKNEGLEKHQRDRLLSLKSNQYPNKDKREAQYYFFSGRALLFYAHRRKAAIRDLTKSLSLHFYQPKGWFYLILALIAPAPVIRWLHQRFLSSHIKTVKP